MTDHTPQDRDLRHLLEDAVADVEPAPALDAIRNRTRARDTLMNSSRPWIFGALGAAVATAATVVAVTVLTDSEPAGLTDPASTPTATPETGNEETASPPENEEVTEETVPVYYVGQTPAGPRLFREFHRAQVTDNDVLLAAVEEALAAANDPDYRSPWADLAATVSSTSDGEETTVDLSASTPLDERPAGLKADEARLAVQQLVYTATAALQSNAPVTFQIDGRPTDRLLGVDVAGGVRRGADLDTLAPVWVTSPQDGDEVGRSFSVEGQGAFFEANVSWQLLDDSGAVVQDGFATARECCTLSPYSFEVADVDPGDYTLRVYAADASGGEGPGEPEDTKRLTAR